MIADSLCLIWQDPCQNAQEWLGTLNNLWHSCFSTIFPERFWIAYLCFHGSSETPRLKDFNCTKSLRRTSLHIFSSWQLKHPKLKQMVTLKIFQPQKTLGWTTIFLQTTTNYHMTGYFTAPFWYPCIEAGNGILHSPCFHQILNTSTSCSLMLKVTTLWL